MIDSLLYSNDSKEALIFFKGKTGLYNLKTKHFLVKPNNSKWTYLQNKDMFLESNEITYQLYHVSDLNSLQIFKPGNNGVEFIYADTTSDERTDFIKAGSQYYNLKTGTFIDSIDEFIFNSPAYFSLNRVDENMFIINDYARMTADLEFHEIPMIYEVGYANSGVFNVQKQNWNVSRIYEECTLKNEWLFCVKRDSTTGLERSVRKVYYRF